MNYIRFNEYGQRSGMEITNIVKLSDGADKIYIFYDLDVSTESSAYRCFARIKRADGLKIADTILTLTIYAFDTEAEAEEYGTPTYNEITLKWDVPCRELTMTEEMLGADGDLQITIVYQEVDQLGSVIATKVNSMSVIPVYDSVAPEYDDASTLEILETFMLRDLSDITDGVQPTVVDKILVRQGGATKLITVGQLNDLLETGITIFKKIAMDTASPASTLSIGETRWNAEVETYETRVSNDVYLPHGQKLVFKCKNTSGIDIVNGTPVYITGASGSSPNFYIAIASSSDYVQTSRCIGLTTEDIDAGAWGKVCVIGIVNGLDTNTFEVGDVVYLGAGGIITTVRPTTNVLALGVVIQKSLTDGRIALRPIFFPRPEDLSTVHYSGLANGDILVKDATGWTNYALANKANVADLTAGTITVKKAEQDKDGNAIDTTYIKVNGANAMTGNLNLGTHKIINVVDGTANQDGATIKNIDTKITAHDGSETAHLYIRTLIETLENEIARLDGRGKSYGEIAYTTTELLALDTATRDATITDAVALGHGGTGYTPSNGDLVYDTGVGAGVSYHEWEFNGTNWVDNGLIGYSKASNTIYGMIKGDGTYLSVVSGLVEVLKSNYADKIGTSVASYTYTQILNAFADRYTKAEVDALLDALKTAFGWEETNIGVYSTPVDLSDYDLVLLKLINTSPSNVSNTQIIRPSSYVTGEYVGLVINAPSDNAILGAGVFEKGTTTWSYQNVSGTNTLTIIGYKIAPILAENVEVAFTGTTYLNSADDVKEALVELDDNLHDAWVEIGAIEDGTVAVAVAGKATNDGNDNQIDTTYETKIASAQKHYKQHPSFLKIKHSAGRCNFSWSYSTDILWIFPKGTVLHSDGTTPIATSTATTIDVDLAKESYVYLMSAKWFGNYELKALNGSNRVKTALSDLPPLTYYLSLYNCSLITGSLSDLPPLTYLLSLYNCSLITGSLSDLPPLTYYLYLGNCSLVTGSLSDLPPLTYWLDLTNCSLITGSLSDLPPLTYWLDLANCYLVTGSLSDLPPLTYKLSLTNCSLVTGVYSAVSGSSVPTTTTLTGTGLSTADMDATLIAYAATTKNNGSFTATGKTRSAASDAAVTTLLSRGWTINGIVKV